MGEEQRRKEEQAAEAKRKQQEKKDREKTKKAEEKKKKAEEQEQQRREQQREEAKQKAVEQAEKDRAAAKVMDQEREVERVAALFDVDRCERLNVLDRLSNTDLGAELQAAYDADDSLRGALHLLKGADFKEEDRMDCLMTLLRHISAVWALGLNPPADVRLPSTTRNRTKKARTLLRDVAAKFFGALKVSAGAGSVTQVTPYQRGMVEGSCEWPVWTVEEREEELRQQRTQAEASKPTSDTPVQETSPNKKGKKAKDTKKTQGEEEDLDSLLAEFGVSVDEKKKKKKR